MKLDPKNFAGGFYVIRILKDASVEMEGDEGSKTYDYNAGETAEVQLETVSEDGLNVQFFPGVGDNQEDLLGWLPIDSFEIEKSIERKEVKTYITPPVV